MQLSDILFRLGIYRIYQCHDYVFTTVTLACQDPELLQALSRRLYPAAAVQCQCTPIAVSRGSAMLYLELGGSTHPSSASLPATRF
ncbi:MAG: sporulation initiation factor Spo0A C-terminal domain-containing protein [Oscillospiraceae bacterium]